MTTGDFKKQGQVLLLPFFRRREVIHAICNVTSVTLPFPGTPISQYNTKNWFVCSVCAGLQPSVQLDIYLTSPPHGVVGAGAIGGGQKSDHWLQRQFGGGEESGHEGLDVSAVGWRRGSWQKGAEEAWERGTWIAQMSNSADYFFFFFFLSLWSVLESTGLAEWLLPFARASIYCAPVYKKESKCSATRIQRQIFDG